MLMDGFVNGDVIGEGLFEGIINFFGFQSVVGMVLLEKVVLMGFFIIFIGKVWILKVIVS